MGCQPPRDLPNQLYQGPPYARLPRTMKCAAKAREPLRSGLSQNPWDSRH